MLLTGECKGEPPEVFTRRFENFREAGKAEDNMAAKHSAVRRKNAVLKHVESDREESVVCVPGDVGTISKESPAKTVPGMRGGSVSVTGYDHESVEPAVEGVFAETDRVEGFGAERGEDVSRSWGDDVREYRQSFKGFKSAYSAYYSVFGSQVRRKAIYVHLLSILMRSTRTVPVRVVVP